MLIARIAGDLMTIIKTIYTNIKREIDMMFQSQQDTDMRQQTLNAGRKTEIELFSASIKVIKQRHEALLGSIESL